MMCFQWQTQPTGIWIQPIHSSTLLGVLLSPRTTHIPAELCDSAGGKLSAGMELQQLCCVATQAEIYDSSSKNCGVAEGKQC